MKNQEKRTIVVMGASRGIGHASAKLLTEQGFNIISISRSPSDVGISMQFDLYRQKDREKCITYLQREYSNGIYGILYCLGSYLYDEENIEEVEHLWQTNVVYLHTFITGLKNLLEKGAFPFNMEPNRYKTTLKKTSSIVAVASIDSIKGGANGRNPLYAAAKGAQVSYLRRISVSLSPIIRVNWIHAGFVMTSFTKDHILYYTNRDFKDQIDNKTLLNRAGAPTDIAALCSFLLDHEKSGWITGSGIVIDGGASVR